MKKDKRADQKITDTWELYEQGKAYKTDISLYSTVNVNERFVAGDQWAGIQHKNLPAPVHNILRQGMMNAVALVNERSLTMMFSALDGADSDMAIFLSNWAKAEWERQNMQYLILEGLEDAAVTGDFIYYAWWDEGVKAGMYEGEVCSGRIDNVNYYPGNPNDPDVQSQPYIILAFRMLVDKAKKIAKENKVPQSDIDRITSDDETLYTAGDRGRIELKDSGKCLVLLKMWKKDSKVWFKKSTKAVDIMPATETRLTLYPIALMNWWPRKNSCHGTAPITQCVPNQVYINRSMAMAQLYVMLCAFPRLIYDQSRITNISNEIGKAIPVNGDISGTATYLSPPQVPFDVYQMYNATRDITLQMLGANDILLGNIDKPDNTSAFIAIRESAAMPMRTIQLRLYKMVEDIGKIWLDFFANYYHKGRGVPVYDANGNMVYVKLDENVIKGLKNGKFNLRIDVGPANIWSETTVINTLDNMRAAGMIDDVQYIERLPNGTLPKQDMLLAEKRQEKELIMAQAAQELAAQTPQGAENPELPAGQELSFNAEVLPPAL